MTKKPASKHSATWRMPTTVSLPALLEKGFDTRFRQLIYDMVIATAHLDAARAYLADKLGVTPPQYTMLMVIAQAGSTGISVNEVADRLHVRGTFVTAEIKKLQKQVLVEKRPNPDDARSVLLELTGAAQERITALRPELLLVNDHMFQHLSADDFLHLSRIISSLVEDFENTAVLLQAARKSARAAMRRLPRA